MSTPRPRLTRRRVILAAVLLLVVTPLALFTLNGLVLAKGETPVVGETDHPAAEPPAGDSPVVKLLAYNIAKGFVYEGGLHIEKPAAVQARMDRIAEIINAEAPDLVFLSETVRECTPCPIDQVRTLAEATGMHAWAFGENYNFGLPFYRMVGGNAILSRWPLTPVGNPSLAGRRPFFLTHNSRRVLWCSTRIAGRDVLLGSIHNDSFNLTNNLAQLRQELDFAGDRDTILAGDFNARPDDPPIRLLRDSGRFAGSFDGPMTFPSDAPDRRIDFIFAPVKWRLLETRIIGDDVSDHLAVVSRFCVRR